MDFFLTTVVETGFSDLTVVEVVFVGGVVVLALRVLLLISITNLVASSLGGSGGLGLVIGGVFTSVLGSSILDGADEVDSKTQKD